MDLGASCEFDRIAQQAVIIGAVLNTGYETTVDLDLIETEIFQIAEAGITGAEIVDCNADTGNLPAIKNTVVIFIILQLDAFRKLQRQCIAGQPGFAKNIQYRGSDMFIKKLNIGEVYTDTQTGQGKTPFSAGLKGSAKYPLADRDNQAALLKRRNEFYRTDDTARGRLKTQKCFHSADPAALALQLRLITKKEAFEIV